MDKKIKLYFCNIPNFGDALNKYIFKECFDTDIEYSDSWECDAFGIGSILELLLWQTKDAKYIFKNPCKINKNPVYIFSSGFGWDDKHYFDRIRFFFNMNFKRRPEIVSLRGELTRKSAENILKKDLSDVALGDLGLLASYLCKEQSEKKYELGICPHFAYMDNPIFAQIAQEIPNSIILDTKTNPVEYVNKLNQCKTVISSGLHPLICADSLGIPNLWVRISEKTTTRHKYADYYSVFGIDPKPCNLYENKISTDYIIENYKIKPEQVKDIQQNLIKVHKEFFKKKFI